MITILVHFIIIILYIIYIMLIYVCYVNVCINFIHYYINFKIIKKMLQQHNFIFKKINEI